MKKILIVEDEEILAGVLKERFEKSGFSAEVVTKGDEVVSAVKKFMPDFVLLDILLPNKDGIKVLKELKDEPELKKIPVMIISNLGDESHIEIALFLGAVDYVVKTEYHIDKLVERVSTYLSYAKTA